MSVRARGSEDSDSDFMLAWAVCRVVCVHVCAVRRGGYFPALQDNPDKYLIKRDSIKAWMLKVHAFSAFADIHIN